ncbi:MAG: bifunctional 5,10-methylenetetrahydrofolate dehydrogenase/5,10-methenyltetrahydrofolate cyclohydrolase [Cryobacterium sp.]|nr:bifunctional 5,10-methylenetetrahydrofolate dehydrogenase/5,10-methenyltetrahydrofolate cyclohydrolase [Oligoflexia bacterium]
MKRLESRPYRDSFLPTLKAQVADCIRTIGRRPALRVVIVGEDPASQIYVAHKEKLAAEIGMDSLTVRFPSNVPSSTVRDAVAELNSDPNVDGILIQRPLPKHFREEDVLLWILPAKDVDAFHPETVGRMVLGLEGFTPCTPGGCLKLLDFYGYDVRGKIACVVGRSSIVGKPLAALLLARDATVLHCHSQTNDLASMTRQADFLFVAIGKGEFIRKEHVKPGAVVVDVGVSRNEDGKIVGDVAYEEVSEIAAALTPVPGGIGPMTILGLLENTLTSARRSAENREKK